MTDEQRAFEVGEVLHALVFQLSVADVSFLPMEELVDKPKLHDDGLGDLEAGERAATMSRGEGKEQRRPS